MSALYSWWRPIIRLGDKMPTKIDRVRAAAAQAFIESFALMFRYMWWVFLIPLAELGLDVAVGSYRHSQGYQGGPEQTWTR